MNSEKKSAWDTVHAAYKGMPIVGGEKKKFIIKRKSPPSAMPFAGGAQKEEIPEREEEAPKEVKAKKEPKKAVKKIVSPYAIEDWLEDLVKVDLVEGGTLRDLGKEADDYIKKLQDEGEYGDILEESLVGRGHGDVAQMIYKHFLKQGNSPEKIKASMRELMEEGYSMFEDIVGVGSG